jgi:hypothetical protein
MGIYSAALMHDNGDAKYVKNSADSTNADDTKTDTDESKAERERGIIQKFLKLLDLPLHIAATAAYVASCVSFTRELRDTQFILEMSEECLALKFVHDVDRLDALGHMGVVRNAYFGGSNKARQNNTILTVG